MLARRLTPILNVSDIQQSFAWFEKLGWKKGWDWGEPPTFGGVCSGECEIFLCQGAQGGRGNGGVKSTFGPDGDETADKGAWMSIWVDDVDAVHRRCLEQGLDVAFPPTDMPWNVREMHVRHPDGHVFRISRGLGEHDEQRGANAQGMRVRRAVDGDAPRIAELLGELGYPAETAAVQRRLGRLGASRAIALVADEGGDVVALCTGHLFDVIHEDAPVVMISVLVVSARARRRGVGRRLMTHAERWAQAAEAGRVVIASGHARSDAHAFYESLGYQHNARRYIKRLNRSDEA